MSDEKNTQVNSKHHKKHRGHHYAVLPYITTPIIFALIAFIIALPIMKFMLNKAVDTVHTAQQTLAIDYNDYVPIKTDDDKVAWHSDCKWLGTVKCSAAGLNADLYQGLNRVAYRNGAGIAKNAKLVGGSDSNNIFGYPSTAFKALYKVSVGDVVEVTVNGKTTKYRVTSTEYLNKAPSISENDILLCTYSSNKAFSNLNGNKLFVVAQEVA